MKIKTKKIIAVCLIMVALSILLPVTANLVFEEYGMNYSKFAQFVRSLLIVVPLGYAVGFYFEETEKQ